LATTRRALVHDPVVVVLSSNQPIRKLARERGVRAIHGDAPYMRLEPERVYEICLRSTGEVIITPGTRMAPPQMNP
jgi:hypothetical protein